MKPPAFDYHRPGSVEEAVRVLADLGPDAKVLAGGQSLVPLLNMRLAAPKALVDINRLADLSYVQSDGETVRVGALTRHAHLTRDGAHSVALPILGQATRNVAHETIRNRGTTVGSIVHADPAGEMPAVLLLLCDGSVQLASATGTRDVAAAEFFLGPLESALGPGELAISATFRVPPGRTGSAWLEVSRRAGDYAMCGVGVIVTLADDRTIASARGRLQLGRADPGAGRPRRRRGRRRARRRRLGRGRRPGPVQGGAGRGHPRHRRLPAAPGRRAHRARRPGGRRACAYARPASARIREGRPVTETTHRCT